MQLDRSNLGLVVVDHGSRSEESNQRLLEFVDVYRSLTRYRIVEPAHMELATPSIEDAFRACSKQGVSRIIISPFFLLPGRHWQNDIPRLCRQASGECGNIPFLVAAPIGVHEKLVEVMESRIERCVEAVGEGADWAGCSCCNDVKNCRVHSDWTTA